MEEEGKNHEKYVERYPHIFVITLIAGAVLGLVYDVTKEPIAHQQQLAKDAAYKEVFADAEKFEEIAVKPDLAPEDLTAYVNG